MTFERFELRNGFLVAVNEKGERDWLCPKCGHEHKSCCGNSHFPCTKLYDKSDSCKCDYFDLLSEVDLKYIDWYPLPTLTTKEELERNVAVLARHVAILHKLLEDHLKDDSMQIEILKKHTDENMDSLEVILQNVESIGSAFKKMQEHVKDDIKFLTEIQEDFKAFTEKLDSLEQRVKVLEEGVEK